jgi:hypothetical protein
MREICDFLQRTYQDTEVIKLLIRLQLQVLLESQHVMLMDALSIRLRV